MNESLYYGYIAVTAEGGELDGESNSVSKTSFAYSKRLTLFAAETKGACNPQTA